jgi:CHAT domain-containing protein
MLRMPALQKRVLLLLAACEAGAVAATADDRNAWGIPGALVAAGASAVLANLWPVEDITSTYLLERFLHHLGHRGYRPAAALFRAVRDLRRLGRDDALAYCRRHFEMMKSSKAPARAIIGARTMLEWVEDSEEERPFAHPYFWGAAVIFGSGWHLPAGAVVAPIPVTMDNVRRQIEADQLLAEGKPTEALELARLVVDSSDGARRGHACTTMALALLQSSALGSRKPVLRRAARLLDTADRLATNEGDEKLRERAGWVRMQMENHHLVSKDS